MKNVYPYPNPFTDEVEFTFHINQPSNIEIIVFELSGKPIYHSEEYKNIAPGLIRYLKWDGITDYGTRISNGTYFYTVKATSLEKTNVITKLQKLSKIN